MDRVWLDRELPAAFLPSGPIRVIPGQLRGRLMPPPSKSVLHRALICAALSDEANWLEAVRGADGFVSADIKATIAGLDSLLKTRATAGKQVLGRSVEIHCGESGSTLRFLLPVAAALGVPAVFTGEGALPDRPLREFTDVFAGRVNLDFPSDGRALPLSLSGQLQPGLYQVPGHISSQYITGLLLALGRLGGESRIILTSPLSSRPYVDLTLAVMAGFGVTVVREETVGPYGGYFLSGSQAYRLPRNGYRVEPDFSQAAFWLVARFIGHAVEVEALPPDSWQGDSRVLTVLDQLEAIRESGRGNLRVQADDIPDLVPILSLAAATVPGCHSFTGVKRLRLKECDRLQASREMLASTGIRTDYDDSRDELSVYGLDSLEVLPGLAAGAVPAPTYGDHRMAMAQTILGCSSRLGYTVDRPSCVAKSWPDFYRDFAALGGTYMEVAK